MTDDEASNLNRYEMLLYNSGSTLHGATKDDVLQACDLALKEAR